MFKRLLKHHLKSTWKEFNISFAIIIILGLCLTFLPVLMYFNYLLTHVSKKTSFDYHVDIVEDFLASLFLF